MFKPHDKVRHKPTGFTGVVSAVYPDQDAIVVHYDQSGILPCKLPSSEYELIAGQCPLCQGPWTETYVFGEPKYDCLKCNKKKEDIEKEVAEIDAAFAGYGEDISKESLGGSPLTFEDVEKAVDRIINGSGKP